MGKFINEEKYFPLGAILLCKRLTRPLVPMQIRNSLEADFASEWAQEW